MYGGLPMTVVPCAAISRKRDVPKSATFSIPLSDDQHVRRPQVAVQHALPVRVVDGVADLAGVVERERDVERALARDDRLERFARHELHHDEEDVLLLFSRQDRDDVGMIEAGEEPRLAKQLAEVDALLVRNLQRDLLVDPGVFGEIDRAEPAAADRREDLVLADDLTAEKHRCAEYSSEVQSCRDAVVR